MGLAFTGCSDNVIEVDSQGIETEKTPAYLTVAFSSNATSSRSTADDANNQGDKDGDQESSGHINAGTAAENAVNSALVVVKETDGNRGYAKLYSTPDLVPLPAGKDETGFMLNEPIQLNTGFYEVLVVANPYEEFYPESVIAGTSKTEDVTALYNRILTGDYDVTATSVANFAGEIVQVDGENNLKGIMMANKAMATVEVKAGNLKLTPAEVNVQIERVASKITYRHYGYDGKEAVEITDDNKDNVTADVYPVNVTLPSKVSPITYDFSYTIGDPDGNEGQLEAATETLNEALLDGEKVYVVLDKDGFSHYYKAEHVDISKNGVVNIEDRETNMIDELPASPFIFQYKAEESTTSHWFVKIEKYALVNLARSVYHVRHTTFNGTGVQFGTLNGSNYLYTPNWANGINDATFDEDGSFLSGEEKTSEWFNNRLADVSVASKAAEPTVLFHDFASSVMGKTNDAQGVTGGNHHGGTLSPVGDLLAYCLENSTDVDHQRHALSTGIAFMAKIYSDEECTEPIETLYRYAGHLFTAIGDIQKAYNITVQAGASGLAGLTEDSDADALKAAGVVKYAGNTCYYYTTEIKHWDNGDSNVLGNMEFAIMRNNIYSLAITGVNIIGDPYVDPTPSTPNEVLDTYLNVEAVIEPWTVRYHDIEFN